MFFNIERSEVDLALLHAPSVYDFRNSTLLSGPISDVVPSSPVFEMYPIGLTSIAEYLERFGLRVKVINLANRMLLSEGFDVERKIQRTQAKVFGIDLHWLPHAHGAIEIAKIVKKYHPDKPVVFGGLSSTYYHEELIQYPFIDFVVRGDSTEKLMLSLLNEMEFGTCQFESIPNLTWKDQEGKPHFNPLTYVPDHLDDIDIPAYRYVVRSVFKYKNFLDPLPYKGWLKYPNTAILTARGCTQGCLICGGSRIAYETNCGRKRLALRSPGKLLEDILFIQRFTQAPIFILHDIRQGGQDYVDEFLGLLKEANIQNELVFELFQYADEAFFAQINDSVPRYSMEMTLETHDEAIRMENGKFRCTNEKVTQCLQYALKHGCSKIDLFFMTGIPRQTYESAMQNVDFIDQIHQECGKDKRLSYFIAPLAPFLDPSSPAFENPELYGYKKLCHTLEDHRKHLLQPSWKYMLSYETNEMSRDVIVRATYDSASRLNDWKRENGLISEEIHETVQFKIRESLQFMEQIDHILTLPEEEQEKSFRKLKTQVNEINRHSICGKDELKWELKKNYPNALVLAKIGLELFWEDKIMIMKKHLGMINRRQVQMKVNS